MSERRTTIDRTEVEDWESERNRVAWNLPRGVRPAASKRTQEAARESHDSRDAAEAVAEDG